MAGIFNLVGELIADLAARALTEVGRTAIGTPRTENGRAAIARESIHALPAPIDEVAVIAAYERQIGAGADLETSLFHGPLTPIVALAGLGDLALPIALFLPIVGSRFQPSFPLFGLVLAATWFVGFRLSRPDLEWSTRKQAMPIGLFTGLLLRARRLRRASALGAAPFSSDDPKVIGPVVREWALPLLERAATFPPTFLRLRVAELERLGGDSATIERLNREAAIIDERRESALAAMRNLVADPLSIHRSPLIAARETFAALGSALDETESLRSEIDTVRRNLTPTRALEEPIRLNAG